jgi:hypothetical protein
MTLSLPHMFSLFNGLPHSPRHNVPPVEPSVQPPIAPSAQHPAPLLPPWAPGFLHAGFAPFEPDLTKEIRQAPGEQAALRAGAVP